MYNNTAASSIEIDINKSCLRGKCDLGIKSINLHGEDNRGNGGIVGVSVSKQKENEMIINKVLIESIQIEHRRIIFCKTP